MLGGKKNSPKAEPSNSSLDILFTCTMENTHEISDSISNGIVKESNWQTIIIKAFEEERNAKSSIF